MRERTERMGFPEDPLGAEAPPARKEEASEMMALGIVATLIVALLAADLAIGDEESIWMRNSQSFSTKRRS